MKATTFSTPSKWMLLVVSLFFAGSLFVPMWRIELEAPQYPEGLVLQLHAHKIGGDVEIINGLNHYIGMATLHTENFFEFSVLPYVFAGFSFLSLILIFVANRKAVMGFFVFYLLFVVVAAIDFYRWNYEYGHNLDPNAAIKVPGMAYQPPLIGYKQLLNFGAYSLPDVGGWLLAAGGLLLFIILTKEYSWFSKKKNAY